MIPILFEHDATTFDTHGLGDLVDCIKCETTCNSDGEYELQLQYPVNALMFPELKINRIVYAKANDYDPWQAFRIYGYEKEIKGVMTINCQHISYDLHCIPTREINKILHVQSCAQALAMAKANAFFDCPFNFYTDITRTPHMEDHVFKAEAPTSIRALLLDGDESIHGCWGGDLVFDNWNISLLSVAGQDRGTVINYGVDLIDLTQEENISNMITGILPYFRWNLANEDSESIDYGEISDFIAYGDVQQIPGTFDRQNIQAVDLTDQFPNQEQGTYPPASLLNAKAQEWIEANDVGHPEISLTVNYATLGQDVRLHDVVMVRFPRMNIDVKSKVTSYKYDVLAERPVEIEIGKTKASSMFSLEDASRLKKGLIPPKRIQKKSIGQDQIQNGGVGGSNVSKAGIAGWHLRDKAVKEAKIDDDAVTVYKIKDGAVVTDKIALNAVEKDRLAAASVGVEKLDEDLTGFYTFWLKAKLIFADEILAEQGDYGWITTGHIKGTWLYGGHLAIKRNGIGEYIEYYHMDVDLPVVANVSGSFVTSLSADATYIPQTVYGMEGGAIGFVNCPYVVYTPSYGSVSVTDRTYHLHYLGNSGSGGD